jgi:hypothetical protein
MKLYKQSSVVVAVAVILSTSSVFAEESPPPFHYSDDWTLVSAPPPTGPYRSVNIDPRIPGAGAVEPMRVMPSRLRASGAAEPAPAPANAAAAVQTAPPAQEQYAPEAPVAAEEPPAPVAAEEPPAPEKPVAAAESPAPVEPSATAESPVSVQAPGAPEIATSVPGNAPAAGIPAAAETELSPLETARPYGPPAAGEETEYGEPHPGSSGQMPPSYQPPLHGYGRAYPPPPMRNYPAPRYPYYQQRYRGTQNAVPPPGYYNPQRSNEEPEVPPPPAYEGMYGRPPYPGNGW